MFLVPMNEPNARIRATLLLQRLDDLLLKSRNLEVFLQNHPKIEGARVMLLAT